MFYWHIFLFICNRFFFYHSHLLPSLPLPIVPFLFLTSPSPSISFFSCVLMNIIRVSHRQKRSNLHRYWHGIRGISGIISGTAGESIPSAPGSHQLLREPQKTSRASHPPHWQTSPRNPHGEAGPCEPLHPPLDLPLPTPSSTVFLEFEGVIQTPH